MNDQPEAFNLFDKFNCGPHLESGELANKLYHKRENQYNRARKFLDEITIESDDAFIKQNLMKFNNLIIAGDKVNIELNNILRGLFNKGYFPDYNTWITLNNK
jgi:hypothetical protein